MGLGCCIAAEDVISDEDVRGRLCFYPLAGENSCRTIYAAYCGSFYLTQACRELIEVLADKP
jgi:DNA-binding transcriptional LysR family regulator